MTDKSKKPERDEDENEWSFWDYLAIGWLFSALADLFGS